MAHSELAISVYSMVRTSGRQVQVLQGQSIPCGVKLGYYARFAKSQPNLYCIKDMDSAQHNRVGKKEKKPGSLGLIK